jgi:UDP-N-acetylglucosamine transferase subunit ALG13
MSDAGTTLLVASGGGHLQQLHQLLPRLRPQPERQIWLTFDTALSRSLLADEEVVYLPYAAPRDTAAAVANARRALALMRRHRVHTVVSTGAHPALSCFGPARALGVRCHYIESATRSLSPSMTGRVSSFIPGVQLYTQHRRWAGGRWRYAGSVLDDYIVVGQTPAVTEIRRAVVTVGTNETYPFRRMIEAAANVLPSSAEVLWQVGSSDVSDLGIAGRASVPGDEMADAVAQADVVIAHAGTGSAISALRAGKLPVLLPRSAADGEHIDDHQANTAYELQLRGLALVRSSEALSVDDLIVAANRRVVTAGKPMPFRLMDRAS